MRILHVCNWCSGITTNNVRFLKQYSHHSHELVTRIVHPYDMAVQPTHLTERETTQQMVLDLAGEADVLHFHATGYDGTPSLPETIHGIDWSQFLGKKKFVLHGMCSYLNAEKDTFAHYDVNACEQQRFLVRNLDAYAALMGPHLSCKSSYAERLRYVPDMIPIEDWLYTPFRNYKPDVTGSFKNFWIAQECRRAGIDFRFFQTPTKLTDHLQWKRTSCRVFFDNCTDGHWGLAGMEALSQAVPCVVYTHPINKGCWDVLGVPPPPFLECEHGGADALEILQRVMGMQESDWEPLAYSGRRWIEEHYNPEQLVARWDSVYGELETKGELR